MATLDLVSTERTARPVPRMALLSLEAELRREVEGEVRSEGPNVVVVARTKDDVIATQAACRRRGVPVVVRGSGASAAAKAPARSVVVDLSALSMVLEIDPAARTASVEAGVTCAALDRAVAGYGLAFGARPPGRGSATIGGVLGANAIGPSALVHGDGAALLEEAEILLADGTKMRAGWTTIDEMSVLASSGGRVSGVLRDLLRVRTLHGDALKKKLPRVPHLLTASGLKWLVPDREGRLNLARVLTGSLGTLATVLEAKVSLVEERPFRVLLVAGFEDVFAAADAVPLILDHAPMGLEGIDARLASTLGLGASLLPEGSAWLVVELGAYDGDDVADNANELIAELGQIPGIRSTRVISTLDERVALEALRERAFSVETSGVSPLRLGFYLRDLDALLASYGWAPPLGGHFGLGLVSGAIDRTFATPEAEERYRAYLKDLADLVHSYGGTIASEHLAMERTVDPEILAAMRRLKGIFDPDALLNPAHAVEPVPFAERTSPVRSRSRKASLRLAAVAFGAAAALFAIGFGLRRLHVFA